MMFYILYYLPCCNVYYILYVYITGLSPRETDKGEIQRPKSVQSGCSPSDEHTYEGILCILLTNQLNL